MSSGLKKEVEANKKNIATHETNLTDVSKRLDGHDNNIQYHESWLNQLEDEHKFVITNIDNIASTFQETNATIFSNDLNLKAALENTTTENTQKLQILGEAIDTQGLRIDKDVDTLWPLFDRCDAYDTKFETLEADVDEFKGDVGKKEELEAKKKKQEEEEGDLKDKHVLALQVRLDAVDELFKLGDTKMEEVTGQIGELETFKAQIEEEKILAGEEEAKAIAEGTQVDDGRVRELEGKMEVLRGEFDGFKDGNLEDAEERKAAREEAEREKEEAKVAKEAEDAEKEEARVAKEAEDAENEEESKNLKGVHAEEFGTLKGELEALQIEVGDIKTKMEEKEAAE
jgi:chromosome segregation ATPase